MATAALRTTSAEHVVQGLMALVLDDEYLDYRDILTDATVLYDASLRVKIGPDDLFARCAQFAAPKRRALLVDYLRPPGYTKSIASKGVKLIDTVEGPAYVLELY
jgi:hypothetical protein